MTVKFDVPNYELLVNKLADNITDKVGIAVENQAKLTSPVDTGYYRNQIKYEKDKSQVIANAEYSAPIEYGVKGTQRRPRPVMRNAARNVQQKVDRIAQEELSRV